MFGRLPGTRYQVYDVSTYPMASTSSCPQLCCIFIVRCPYMKRRTGTCVVCSLVRFVGRGWLVGAMVASLLGRLMLRLFSTRLRSPFENPSAPTATFPPPPHSQILLVNLTFSARCAQPGMCSRPHSSFFIFSAYFVSPRLPYPITPSTRDLLRTPRIGMDFTAGVVETKMMCENDDPRVR